MRKSGTNGVIISTICRDKRNTMVPLPRTMTFAQATAATHQLGQPGLGVVITKNGYGARCLHDNRAAVEAQLFPATASLLEDFIALDEDNAQTFLVKGFEDTYTKDEVYDILKRSLGWGCKPVRPLRGSAWGTTDREVLAPAPPARNSCHLLRGHRSMTLGIHKQEKRTTSPCGTEWPK